MKLWQHGVMHAVITAVCFCFSACGTELWPMVGGVLSPSSLTPLENLTITSAPDPMRGVAAISTESNLTVAFLADTGAEDGFQQVLDLIKKERVNDEPVDAVVVSGDLSYSALNDNMWINMVNTTLGNNFPVFLVKGNHEWAGGWREKYGPFVANKISNLGILCTGETSKKAGRNTACVFKGLHVVMSDAGESGKEDIPGPNTSFINTSFAYSNSIWRLCIWHRNQKKLRVRGRADEVGWAPYEACRKHGALIVNGHDHVYARTRTLTDMVTQQVDSDSTESNPRVAPGATFVVIAGIGGLCCRDSKRFILGNYWSAVRTSTSETTGANGALFITFNAGDPHTAIGYYKSVRGVILDRFTITFDVSGF